MRKIALLNLLFFTISAMPVLGQVETQRCDLRGFSLSPPQLLETGRFRQVTHLSLGDINGDNQKDIVFVALGADNYYQTMLSRNLGPALGFGAAESLNINSLYGIELEDVNGDRKNDLVGLRFDGITVAVNENGQLGSKREFSHNIPGIAHFPQSLVVGDFNKDKFLDIAATYQVSTNPNDPYTARRAYAAIFLNDPSNPGSFKDTSHYLIQNDGGIAGVSKIAKVDLNGDGALELVVDNYSRNHTYILANNGRGVFELRTIDVGRGTQGIDIYDINRDGRLDILFGAYSSGSHGASIYLNEGNGTVLNGGFQPLGGRFKGITNFDRDLLPDYLHSTPNDSRFEVDLTRFPGTWSQPYYPFGIELGDLNGDGFLDMVTDHYNRTTQQYSLAVVRALPICR